MVVCSSDISHKPRPVPCQCNLPFCPECEQRSHIRRVERYTYKFMELHRIDKAARPGWSIKHIILTHPARLGDNDCVHRYREFWCQIAHFRQLYYDHILWHERRKVARRLAVAVMFLGYDPSVRRFLLLTSMAALERVYSAAEIRRGRVDLNKHDLGFLVGVEFGEKKHRLHGHIAANAPYVDQATLSLMWELATEGEAKIMQIKQVKQDEVKDAIREVIKYSTKPLELPPALAPKLLEVLQGRLRRSRRIRAYGRLRTISPPAKEPCKCVACNAKLTRIYVQDYFRQCIELRKPAEPEIIAIASDHMRNEYEALLRLIRQAKVGERGKLQQKINRIEFELAALRARENPDPMLRSRIRQLWRDKQAAVKDINAIENLFGAEPLPAIPDHQHEMEF